MYRVNIGLYAKVANGVFRARSDWLLKLRISLLDCKTQWTRVRVITFPAEF